MAMSEDKSLEEHSTEFLMTVVLTRIFPRYSWDDNVAKTAERFVRFLTEFVPNETPNFTFTTFPTDINQLIIVRDIELSSICKHHLLPFMGKAHVGYIPTDKIAGLSKLPRIVEFWSRRPQTQEALTAQIATDLKQRLSAMGVAVVIEAAHTCMGCRGIRQVGAVTVTSEMRGVFLTSEAARMEFLNRIR